MTERLPILGFTEHLSEQKLKLKLHKNVKIRRLSLRKCLIKH